MEFLRRQITAPRPQIGSDVPQNIQELQAFPVLHARGAHPFPRFATETRQMPEADPGPKLSHGTGHQVGVTLKVARSFERRSVREIAEALHVERLTLVNIGEHSPDIDLISASH